MQKLILSLLFLSTLLFAYVDSDMDGVEDKFDKCPNTPLTDLVNADGCTKQSLGGKSHYDIIVGAGYTQTDYALTPNTDTYSTLFQADYYYNNFALGVFTSFYKSTSSGYSKSGMDDTIVEASYVLQPSENIGVRMGGSVILPTYNSQLHNNNTDYRASVNVSRYIDNATLFAGYAYTIINDSDVVNATNRVYYQNTNAFHVGAGYQFMPKFYASLSYFQANSVYKGAQDLQNISIYGFYSINLHWFSNFSYSRGLNSSTSKNSAYVNLGYYF